MMPMKIAASTTVGSACPTLSVPGMRSSGTKRKNLNSDVVVANDPIPSVSKKFVTNPIAIAIAAASGSGMTGRWRGSARTSATIIIRPTSSRPMKRMVWTVTLRERTPIRRRGLLRRADLRRSPARGRTARWSREATHASSRLQVERCRTKPGFPRRRRALALLPR